MTSIAPQKSVMLYATVDTFGTDRGAAAFSLELCGALQASLTALLLNLDANAPAVGKPASPPAMEELYSQRAAANSANAEALCEAAAQRGIPARSVTGIDHSRGVINYIADHARLHDVVVSGVDSQGLMSDRLVAQDLLFLSGRPQIVVPGDWHGSAPSGRIVAAWDNTPVAARALFSALNLIPGVSEVVLLTIGGEKAVPSSFDISQAAELLGRRGVPVRGIRRELGGRSIGVALQEEAQALDASILAMGGYAHSRLRDLVLGGATLEIVAQPRMPVLLSH